MKNAILLHGTCDKEEYFDDKYPSLSNSHWFPWLQKQLLVREIFTQTPEMPDAYSPDYGKWKNEFEKFSLSKESVLVGHSCGAGFFVRWLSENKIDVAKLILVAPWLDPSREKTTDFFDFSVDSEITSRVGEIHILFSTNDSDDVLESVNIIKKHISGGIIHKFSNKGHFTLEDMKIVEFPELLEIILK